MLLELAAIGGEVSGTLAQILWKRVSRSGRLAQALRQLQLAGVIEVHGAGPIDERIIRLTTTGRTGAARPDPPALWSRTWDGIWRIVAFDIPDTEAALRAKLRRKLHTHRFGWLQNSVWISPDPIASFRAMLHEKHMRPDSLTYLEARPVGGETPAAIVTSAWDFAAVDKTYTYYLKLLQLHPNRLQRPAAWMNWVATEHRAWRQIVRIDPFLPDALLPKGYRGRAVWHARQEAIAALRTALS